MTTTQNEENARAIFGYFANGDANDDRTLGEIWADNTGSELPEGLEFVNDLSGSDAIQSMIQLGSAAASGAALVSTMLTSLGAAATAVPIAGWCVAAAVVIANTALAVFSHGRALAESRRSGRHVLLAINECVRLLGYDFETRRYADWGHIPQWKEGDHDAAYWHLRLSELAGVLGGSFLETGLHGSYRHGLLVDVETGTNGFNHGDQNDGFPYIPYNPVRPQLLLSSGASAHFTQYGRGTYHINTARPFLDFWRGSGPKAERRMMAHNSAAQSLLTMLQATSSVNHRKAIVAALLLAAQKHYSEFGVRFPHGAPESLETIVSRMPVTDVQYSAVTVQRASNIGINAAVVRSARPFRVASRATTIAHLPAMGPRKDLNLSVTTDDQTPQAIFLTRLNDLDTQYLVYFGEMRGGQTLTIAEPTAEQYAAGKPITMYQNFRTLLPEGHPGNAWLKTAAGLFTIPNVGLTGESYARPLPLITNPIVLDLDAGGSDLASGEGGDASGGGGAIALIGAGAAIYLATR